MMRRALVTIGCGLAIAASGCSPSIVTSSLPSPSPVTADTVRAAFDNSNMTSAHFTITGSFMANVDHYPATGDGILQRTPTVAFEMNMILQTFSAKGNLVLHTITVGGRDYMRVGSGAWTSKPAASTFAPTAPTSYVGEDTIAGALTWHARSTDSTSTYDLWVRESDGYVVLISINDPSNTLTLSFDSYNSSPVITAP